MKQENEVKVWDLFVRTFHWTLVLGFTLSYVTSQSGMQVLHMFLGYYITAIVILRIVWGFTGSTYARFKSFWFPVTVSQRYLKDIVSGNPAHYLGHNPAGAVMVYALLVCLLVVILSGFVVLATIEFEGPLVGFLFNVTDETAYFFLDLHRFMNDVMWVLIALHVTGVIVASFQHHENLVKAMFTGYKKQEDN